MIVPLDILNAQFEEPDYDTEGMRESNKRVAKTLQDYHAEPSMVFRCVIHVQDGKPLTATGARLLGVPWRGLE